MIRFRLKTECTIKRREYINLLEKYTGLNSKDIPYNEDYDVFKTYNKEKGILGIDSIDDDFLENYNCDDYKLDREQNIKLIYYKLNYPYEFYLAYFKIYYPKYSLKELVENKDKYINKEIVDEDYDLYRAGLTINEAIKRDVKFDNFYSLTYEDIIGLTSKILFQKVKLISTVNKEVLKDEALEAIDMSKAILKYYKEDYDIVSKYVEYLSDVLEDIEYNLKNINNKDAKEVLKHICVLKNKIYTLK